MYARCGGRRRRAEFVQSLQPVRSKGASMIEVHPQTRSTLQEAPERYLFTLTFAHGEVALLTISGATDAHHARILAENAIAHCRYTVTRGDSTGGKAHCFYYWHVQAQERNPRLDSLSRGA